VTQVELQEAEQRVKRILGSVDAADDEYISGVDRTYRAVELAVASAPDPSKQQAIAAGVHDSQLPDLFLSPMTKKPRHVSVAINHLLAQRAKAIKVRDKAAEEVESLDAALLALGWGE
jgi:hypothetical protein